MRRTRTQQKNAEVPDEMRLTKQQTDVSSQRRTRREEKEPFVVDDEPMSRESRKSSHHSHKHSSRYNSKDERSSERRYKSVSAASTHREKSSGSHRSASSSRSHSHNSHIDQQKESYHSHGSSSNSKTLVENNLQLKELKSQNQALPPPPLTSRPRTRKRQPNTPNSNQQNLSNSIDDLLFSLIDDKNKKFVPPPADSSSQFDTMTGEEIELHQTLNSPPTPRIQSTHGRKLSHYDFEVFFASRFSAASRNLTLQNYFDDLSPVTHDSREREELSSLIRQKVSSIFGNRSRSQNEWRFFRDSVLRRNFDELLFLSKRYSETSDLQLTRFFASDITKDATRIDISHFDSLKFSNLKYDRICDRTHIISCHIIGRNIYDVWPRISSMCSSVNNMFDLFGESVFNYCMNWLLLFPQDFTKDFYKLFSAAIKSTISVSPNSKFLLYFARSVGRALCKGIIRSDRLQEFPRFSPLSHSQWGMPPLGVPPSFLAEHFMFVECEIVSKLSVDDILCQRFHDIVRSFNNTCDYICRHILTDDSKNRARNISYWIDTMTYSAQLGNLFLVFEISAALNSPAISRLRRSWDLVSGDLKDRFYSIDELTSHYDDYSCMRQFVSSRNKTECLPFVLGYARISEQVRSLANIEDFDIMQLDIISSLCLQIRECGLRTYSLDNSVLDFVRSVKESITRNFDLPIDVLSRKYEPPLSLPF